VIAAPGGRLPVYMKSSGDCWRYWMGDCPAEAGRLNWIAGRASKQGNRPPRPGPRRVSRRPFVPDAITGVLPKAPPQVPRTWRGVLGGGW